MREGAVVPLVFLLLLVLTAGCTTTYADYDYEVKVYADGEATVYLPVALDADTGEVADIVSELEVAERERGAEVDYGVVDTRYGEALRVHTTGDVVLNATGDEKYLDRHPAQNAAGGFPHFFDLTLRASNRSHRPQSYISHYARLKTKNQSKVQVNYKLLGQTEDGLEGWGTGLDNVTLRPGWNRVELQWVLGIS